MDNTVTTSKRQRPIKEAMRAPPPWSQYLSNLSHILFHLACELPFLPSSAMKVAAPSPAEARATVNCHENSHNYRALNE